MREQRIDNRAVHTGSLILVDAGHPFRQPAAEQLLPVGEGAGVLLERRAALLLDRLMESFGGWRGILPVSGWRSREEQQAIWDDTLRREGEAFTRQYEALPGHSEHQTGLAIDLGERREQVDFIRPAFPQGGVCGEFRRRAASHGFIERYPAGKEAVTGIAYEPWHFRYVGAPHALMMAEWGCTLEEYLDQLRPRRWGEDPLRFRREGWDVAIAYLAAAPGGVTAFEVEEARPWCISGNNQDGFILTQWGPTGSAAPRPSPAGARAGRSPAPAGRHL